MASPAEPPDGSDEVHYTTAMAACGRESLWSHALHLLLRMASKRLRPNSFSALAASAWDRPEL